MPGPNSMPRAVDRNGMPVEGKTRLKRAGLRSRQGTSREHKDKPAGQGREAPRPE